MAVMLPPEVSWLLNALGYEWPEANEDTLYEWGGAWQEFTGTVDGHRADLEAAKQHVVTNNRGAGIDAFRERIDAPDEIEDLMNKFGTGGQVAGGLMYVCAGLVVALKITVVVQLVALAIQIAEAIAAAPATFGASTAWIPIAKQLTSRLISLAITTIIELLLA